MCSEQILTNAQLVLKDEVIFGTLVLCDGCIADIDTKNSRLTSAQDLQGDYLIPGMIELHTDNLEKFMSPRPKVNWPTLHAMISHDSQLAGAGITTVFDSLSIGDLSPKSKRLENLKPMLKSLSYTQQHNMTRIEHKLHLRCEVAHPDTYEGFMELSEHELLGLASLMDHSPGQRQFQEMQQYRIYYQGKYGLSSEEMDVFAKSQIANALQYSHNNRLAIAKFCRQNNIPMASHDDATAEHAYESHTLGMKIAEFPTSEIAAKTSHDYGMHVLMGAPNIVRGGSHSGNIAAHHLARMGVLDILSSDYYPNSLLHAALMLTEEDIGYSLPKAIQTVTYAPAKAVNLMDRGEIALGKLADLIRFSLHDKQTLIHQVWKSGKRVA